MVSKSKAKGTYHENWFLKLFTGWGLRVKRQPLSGALGGEYAGDLVIQLQDMKLIAEIKYRRDSGFPSPFRVLVGRDIAFYKNGKHDPDAPRWVMLVPDKVVERFVKQYIKMQEKEKQK